MSMARAHSEERDEVQLRTHPVSSAIYNALPLVLLAGALLFILYPILCVLKTGFFVDGHFSLDIYRKIFAEQSGLILNSALTSGLSTLVTVIFALCVAVYLCFTRSKLRTVMFVVLLLTMISPRSSPRSPTSCSTASGGWSPTGCLGSPGTPTAGMAS